MPRSSNDTANTNIAAFNIAGRSSGTVTRDMTIRRDAPEATPARSRAGSAPWRAARLVRNGIGTVTTVPSTAMPTNDERFHTGSPRLDATWVRYPDGP